MTITYEQLLAAICSRPEPCTPHTEAAERIWARLTAQQEVKA